MKYLILTVLLVVLISCTKNTESASSKADLAPVKQEVKSGKIEKDFVIQGGLLPKGSLLYVYNKEKLMVRSKTIDFKAMNLLIDHRLRSSFWINFNLRCGILAEDSTYNGFKLLKGSIVEFDKNGKLNFRGKSFENYLKQEWIPFEKIFNEKDKNKDDSQSFRPELDDVIADFAFDCYFERIVVKDSFKIHGVTWLPFTVIEFREYSDGLVYPSKVFARKGQVLRGHTLEKDSILLYCWDRKLKQAVIEYETEGTYDDFTMASSGGQICQWSITNIQE